MEKSSEVIFQKEFRMEELKEAIRSTKVKKRGPDDIFPEFIKNNGHQEMCIRDSVCT